VSKDVVGVVDLDAIFSEPIELAVDANIGSALGMEMGPEVTCINVVGVEVES
jgi:hypothetical protein